VSGCQFSTPWKNSFNQHQRNHFINKNDNNIVIDNNIEQFEIEHNSNENEFDYDEEEEDEESFGANDEVKVHRREGSSLPLIPVQHIQTLSTNELTATQQSSVIMNSTLNAQQTLVPPIAGVIKTEI
jgi:hypothetical protein